jgi:carboxyl-terminal processing protease
MTRRRLLAAAAALLFAVAHASARPADDAVAARVATFETVWRIVDEKFFDPGFNGVDWKAVHDRYAPLVAAATSDGELYPILNRMLGELHASHFSVRPPETAAAAADPSDASWGGTPGMTVRVVEGRPVVTDVDPDGPAARAGIRPGFVVTRVGARDLSAVQRSAAGAGVSPVMESFLVRRAVQTALGGMAGKAVEVAYLDGGDEPHVAKVARTEAAGRPITFGELPTIVSRVDARRIDGGVGYVRFNIFLPPLMDEIRAAVRSFAGAPAVIVDLRNNPGGVGLMAPAIASLFLASPATLGTMKLRRGEIRFVTYTQPAPYLGPLVVLVDEGSASTSEILAGALQEMGRAVVVGQPSLGAVLPSLVEKLPNGAVLQYAVADFKTPKGVLLEGRGVLPDVAVPLARRDFLAGRDTTLEAAIEYLKAHPAAAAAPAAP